MQKLSADRKCFVCGPDNETGLHVSFLIDQHNKIAEATISVNDSFQGWRGVVHGGIISALLDEAAIYACRPIALHAVTSALNVRFRKPVATGRRIIVRAEVISVRRKLAQVKSTLSADGEILAEAEVKIMLLNKEEELTA